MGRAYNLVGDVRPTAREYLADVAQVTGRPLKFVPFVAGCTVAGRNGQMAGQAGYRAARAAPVLAGHPFAWHSRHVRLQCCQAGSGLGPVADAKTSRQMAVMVHAEEPVA